MSVGKVGGKVVGNADGVTENVYTNGWHLERDGTVGCTAGAQRVHSGYVSTDM